MRVDLEATPIETQPSSQQSAGAPAASWIGVARGIYAQLDALRRRRLRHILALMIAVGCFETFVVAALAAFVGSIGNSRYFVTQLPGRLLERLAPGFMASLDERGMMLFLGLVLGGLVVAKNGLRALADRKSAEFSSDLDAFFGQLGMQAIVSMPYQRMKRYPLADLSRFIDWRTFIGSDFARSFLNMVQNAVITIIVFASLIVVYPALSLALVASAGAIAAIIYRALRPRIDRELTTHVANMREISRQTLTCLSGMREIKLFGTESKTLRVFDGLLSRVAVSRSRGLMAARVPSYLLDAFGTALLIVVVLSMTFLDYYYSRVTSTAAVFALVALRVLQSINAALSEISSMRAVVPFAAQFLDMLAEQRQFSPDAPDDDGGGPLEFERTLELCDVSFRYDDDGPLAVEALRLSIERGALIGIVGLSGAGKSTVLDLLAGLLTPTAGEVRVDGEALAPMSRRRWRKSIGYVAQSPFFFDGTVAQNIAFEDDVAALDRGRVATAATQGCVDFLDDDGLEMRLTEGGGNLSVGQRQRIAIARALYRDAPLLVFDEPTSALDPFNELKIQALLTGLRGRKTVVVIAHRLSTVEGCDHIAWLEKGRLVMYGPARIVIERYTAHVREKARYEDAESADALSSPAATTERRR